MNQPDIRMKLQSLAQAQLLNEFARQSGVSRRTISRLVNEKREAHVGTLQLVDQALSKFLKRKSVTDKLKE